MSSSKQSNHTFAKVIGRFIFGRDLDGQRRTNATWFRHADKDLTPHGRATRWAHKRHMERAAWRIGASILVLSALYGLATARSITLVSLAVASCATLVFGTWRAYIAIRMHKHNKRIVRPMFQTVALLAGHPPGDSHSKYLTVPRDFDTNEKAVVKLKLSPLWEGNVTQQKAVSGLVARRLAGDWDATYYHHAIPPYATFMRSPAPPKKVSYLAFKPYMDASKPSVLVLGIGANNKLISVDLDSESPHIALSMGVGAGKTSLMALIIAFLVKNGVERIDVINTKRVGYSWCQTLPGVFVHNTITAQMEAIHNIRIKMESRYEEIGQDESRIFPRNVLIIEEQNSWIKYAAQYWADQRQEMDNQERSKTPRQNPAINDIGFILFMGRQACFNVISIFQRMSASASGGGDMRDQYGAKLLARFSPQAFKILVGTSPIPRSSRINGRAIFVLGDEIHAVQLAYLNQDEALEYALSGNAAVNVTGPGTPIVSDDELYSLRELADYKVIPIKYGTLLKARNRDKAFPAPIKRKGVMVYSPQAIQTWHEGRIAK